MGRSSPGCDPGQCGARFRAPKVNPCGWTTGMSKPSPTRYRVTNWSSYAALLRKRGSLPIWLDKEMTRRVPPDDSPGFPAAFSGAAIWFPLSIKVLSRLPLRPLPRMVTVRGDAAVVSFS